MIQFNIHRFAKLARWSLTNDKKYHVKSFLQTFVILLLVFLFFTVVQINVNNRHGFYLACTISVIVSFAVTVILGSSFMFYSMEGKYDMQALLMLPASNFEKYLMRYSSWLILLPLHLVAFLGADLLQYVIYWLIGREEVMFVTVAMVEMISDTWHKMPAELHAPLVVSMFFAIVWLHSCYALGATFFRSKKYNWVATTIVIILIALVQLAIFPDSKEVINRMPTVMEVLIAVVWIIVNFWLSYRLFCRNQVIGKFVNV